MATAGFSESTLRGRAIPVSSVRCSRCHGLMVAEQGFDSLLGTSEATESLRRCVQCGEVTDPVILQNRRLQLGSHLG
jgi:hypothetical protein